MVTAVHCLSGGTNLLALWFTYYFHPIFCLQLFHTVATKMKDGSFKYGLDGFDKKAVERFLLECPVRADRRPLKPDEQPAPQPIVVSFTFEHWQVGSSA